MAKPGSGLRSPHQTAVQERVEQVRSARRGPRWTRPLGVLLMVLALALALDPDYPLAWSHSDASVSARKAPHLLPRALSPKGPIRDSQLRFRWQWDGPEVAWDLVLLDAAWDEVARRQGIHGFEIMADGSLTAALGSGDSFFWCVEASLDGRPIRSRPQAFTPLR